MQASALHPAAAPRPLRDRVMDALKNQVYAAEVGKLKLLIPVVADQFDTSKGRHFHLLPELFIQLGGTSTLRFPREVIRMSPQTVVVVPRGMPHEETARDRPGPFLNLVFAYGQNGVYFHSARSTRDHQPHVADVGKCSDLPGEPLYRHLDEVVELYHRSAELRRLAVRGLMLTHFACLMHALSHPTAPVDDRQESFRIAHCRRLVMHHLAAPELNVQWLANLMACSADYLSHSFHKETGITLTRFINTRRIRQAQSLLAESSMNVSEIGHACGYNDPGYFTRVFRTMAGVTPKHYRKDLRPGAHLPNAHPNRVATPPAS